MDGFNSRLNEAEEKIIFFNCNIDLKNVFRMKQKDNGVEEIFEEILLEDSLELKIKSFSFRMSSKFETE